MTISINFHQLSPHFSTLNPTSFNLLIPCLHLSKKTPPEWFWMVSSECLTNSFVLMHIESFSNNTNYQIMPRTFPSGPFVESISWKTFGNNKTKTHFCADISREFSVQKLINESALILASMTFHWLYSEGKKHIKLQSNCYSDINAQEKTNSSFKQSFEPWRRRENMNDVNTPSFQSKTSVLWKQA